MKNAFACRSRRRWWSFLVLAMTSAALFTNSIAHAVSYNFDSAPFPQNVDVFSQNATGSAVRVTETPVLSPSHALKFSGVDNLNQYPSFAYKRIYDNLDIYVSSSSVLSYQIYPVNPNARTVAVDLVFHDGGTMRDYVYVVGGQNRYIVDDAGVRIHPQFQPARLQVGTWNSVQVPLGLMAGRSVKQILVGYDGPAQTGSYDARLDNLEIVDAKFVMIEGDKVDAGNVAFTDPLAIVDPYGFGSTCGPSSSVQTSSSRACDGAVPHYVARTRIYPKGYVTLSARIPPRSTFEERLDVLVSVCAGEVDEEHGVQFGCREHLEESYCRPKQSSSTAKTQIYIPAVLPPYIDVRWKYVLESDADDYPACDRKAPYAARVLSAELNVDPRLGDADGSGAVTVSDGVIALRCAAGIPGTRCDLLRADLGCDGSVNVSDGVGILRLAAGLLARAGCDRDEDGLLDEWEEFGYDADGNGTVDIPLHDPPYSASAYHKDVFVECDYMATSGAGGHTHAPLPDAVSKAVAMYAQAPLVNLDGTLGVRLHVDRGEMGGASAIPHEQYMLPNPCTRLPQLEAVHRDLPSSIFHYCVFVHHGTGNEGGEKCDNGRSEFYVSQGELTSAGRVAQHQAAALVHELGHDLNLQHGGENGNPYKPNYLSVMSYLSPYGIRFGGVDNGLLDYSRFTMIDLNEAALNEAVGIDAVGGDAQLAGYGTRWYDQNGVLRVTDNAAGSVDWFFNGNSSEPNVSVNLDNGSFLSPLRAWNDWENLEYEFGNIGVVVSPATSFAELEQPIGISCDLPKP